ncbi:MAG: Dam family site-specific DNA-(adenine-N6)-methyltransferase [Pseudomonadota bacterium]|nr:Dam family site-specific DNA-(adenine-N6)-methyltransferase [Pseudomonadota bacterium]
MMQKPFLKWAGGKSKLVPFIVENFPKPSGKRLIEPFAGSAALSLATEFDAYVLNDINPDLIGVFRSLQQEKQSFIAYARSFFTARNNQENRFYALRERFNQSNDTTERAALFIYLNRHAFNGLCRYNSQGAFNVPFGRHIAPCFPEAQMQGFIAKADRFELNCGDFQDVMTTANHDDVVYCDPPYVPLNTTSSFTAYARGGFDLEDQIRLAKEAEALQDTVQGLLISNHDTEFTRKIYQSARLKTVAVQRNISAKGNNRKKVGELLAIFKQ